MEKRIILRIGLVTILSLSLIGCGTSANTKSEQSPVKITQPTEVTPPPSGITVNDIKYEFLNTIPEGVLVSDNRGFMVIEQDNGYLVLIQTGEKPSAGYGVEIESVKDVGGKTEIIVKETEPKPGEMSATVITYPKVAIKISQNIAPNFVVRNSKGESFKILDGKESRNDGVKTVTQEATGLFVGFADPHTVAIIIDGEEKSFQLNERLAQQIQDSKVKDAQKVKIEFTEKDSQLWLVSLEIVK